MITFFKKLFWLVIKIGLVILVIATAISMADAVGRAGRLEVGLIWSGVSAIAHDLWVTSGHFLGQVAENYRELGPIEEGLGPIDWVMSVIWNAGPSLIAAPFQTFGWWLHHGSAAKPIATAVGAIIILFVAVTHFKM